ncbi:hypothetical protein [Alkalihalobacillus sp. CinArs1]|uniref:hypothetical protein n=1 Tax=Alkalihalobacillus sp. CinArs1 TaxID=2995314 RepID=UPI0022DD4A5F|nr:hypothetical protein [Alkalihalobacillus sp. CinArs1]
MAFECPLCNSYTSIQLACSTCGSALLDKGREADYYDDYSPYESFESVKMTDGYGLDEKDHECPHVLSCPECRTSVVYLIEEWMI